MVSCAWVRTVPRPVAIRASECGMGKDEDDDEDEDEEDEEDDENEEDDEDEDEDVVKERGRQMDELSND